MAKSKAFELAELVRKVTISDDGSVENTGDLKLSGSTSKIQGPAEFTIDPAAHGDNTGKVVIAGDLQVDGTTTTINSTTLTVDDKNIVLGSGATASANNGAGITVDGASATIIYTDSTTSWDFNKDVKTTGTVTATGGTSTNWNTAYGWGNHASAGYLTNSDLVNDTTPQLGGNLDVNSNSIVSSSNNNIAITPSGSGKVVLDNLSWPTSDGTSNQFLRTDGSGNLSFATLNSDVVSDTTPQLGGTLDANGNTIDMGTNNITDTKVGQWDTAYGWGNHASGGYAPLATPTFSSSITATTTVNVGTGGGFYFKQDSSKSTIRSEAQPIVLQTWSSSAWQDRVTVKNDGKVGIGTTTPITSHKLTIKETANENASIVFTDTDDMIGVIVGYAKGNNELVAGTTNVDAVLGTTYNSDVHLFTNNAIGLTVQSGGGNPGNVGISTTVPQFKLHVNKGSGTYAPANGVTENIAGFQTNYDSAGSQIVTFANLDGNWIDGTSGSDSAFGWIWGYQNNVRSGLVYDHRGSERMQLWSSYGAISIMTIDAADGDGVPTDANIKDRLVIPAGGNVGIGGDPVPTDAGYNNGALHLRGTNTGSQVHFTTPTSGHTATDGGHISYWNDNNFYYTNTEGGQHRFYTGGTEAINVASGGNVTCGVDIRSPVFRSSNDPLNKYLTPDGTSKLTNVSINGGTSNSLDDATLYVTATNNNDWGLIVNKYNSSATEYGFDLRISSGAAYAMRVLANGSTEKFRIDGGGHIYTQSGISFPDGTTQTTAASGSGGGITAAKAIAMAQLTT